MYFNGNSYHLHRGRCGDWRPYVDGQDFFCSQRCLCVFAFGLDCYYVRKHLDDAVASYPRIFFLGRSSYSSCGSREVLFGQFASLNRPFVPIYFANRTPLWVYLPKDFPLCLFTMTLLTLNHYALNSRNMQHGTNISNWGLSMYGRYYEELEVGKTYSHSPGKTITECDNNFFSLMTMNHHPIHIDQNFAMKQQAGKILTVGTYVFSLVVGQSVRDISGKAIANLEYDSIKHLEPSYIGDTIYSKTTVLEKRISRTKPDRGIVYVETIAYNQDERPVLVLRRRILIPLKRCNKESFTI